MTLQDVIQAARTLRRQPGFALLVVAVLAIGIGTATAIANVYSAVLLRRLPIRDQDRIAVMWGQHRTRQFDRVPLSAGGFRLLRERNRAMTSVAATDYNGAYARLFRWRGEPMELRGIAVSGNFFDVLGAGAHRGRTLTDGDDIERGPGNVVISYAAWVRRFGGDTAILGRTLELVSNGAPFTIVGVMPAGFEYPRGVEFWGTRASMTPSEAVHVIGRLRPSSSIEAARRELTTFFAQDPSPMLRGADGVANALPDLIVGDVRPALRVLGIAVALLLLVSCVNVANLFLIRGVERSREMAVRSALGASRSRLVAQLFAESAIVATAAGLVGIAIAIGMQRALVALAPPELPRLDGVRIGGALLWASITTLVTAVICGVGPAFWTAGVRGSSLVRDAWRSASEGRIERLAKDGLVAAQIALAILILTSAGLVTRSLLRLQRVEVGFAPEHVLVAQLGWPAGAQRGAAWGVALQERLADVLARTPGVVGTAPLVAGPFSGTGGWDGAFVVDGQRADAEAKPPILNMEVASPLSFRAMGITLKDGRTFDNGDRQGTQHVVIVSEATARGLWPGEGAVGKRLKLGAPGADWWTIVGVVGDTRYREFRTSRPTVYFPLRQLPFPFPPTLIAVRTVNDPGLMAESLRRVVTEVDPTVVLSRTTTMTALLDEPLAQPRLNATLLITFATMVVVLAAVGLYGVLAWSVRQRTRELGIRIALGATPGQLRSLVVQRGLLVSAAGILAGLVGAVSVSRLIQDMLFEIRATDPITMAGASVLLLLVALVACMTPARRASRVDPMVAMRAE